MTPLTVNQITNLLIDTRHNGDLCVPECKDGPSQGCKSRRFDLWAMKRSYSNFATFGYEIKVSRGDFLKDEKWQDYLPLCHQFYFVTPWKLVAPEEVPANAGLIWCSSNLSRCYVKKKAEHRNIELPTRLITYILMSRAKITGDYSSDPTDKRAHLARWVQTDGELKELGYAVAKKLRNHVDAIARDNKRLSRENESLATIRDFWVKTLGCRENELSAGYSMWIERANENKARIMQSLLPEGFMEDLGAAEQRLVALERLGQDLRSIRKRINAITTDV